MTLQKQIHLLLAALTTATGGCSNSEQKAVEETLEFAQAAPYALGTSESKYSGFSIVVADSALATYNRLFKYFEPQDTTRARVYTHLPAELLWRLPVTKVLSVSRAFADGDTAKVTAVFQRIDRQLMEKLFTEFDSAADTLAPNEDQQKRFKASLARVHQQLQETDTAVFWVAKGPRISRIRLASEVRDSIAQAKKNAVTIGEFKRVQAEAAVTALRATNYSRLAGRGLDGGGAIEARLEPGSAGWYKPPSGSSMEVQCEASNGNRSTRGRSYIILDRLGQHEAERVLCLWSGDEAREWNDIEPKTFRMRLLGIVQRDTVAGSWVEVPANAVRW